jgi:hypothetical protein
MDEISAKYFCLSYFLQNISNRKVVTNVVAYKALLQVLAISISKIVHQSCQKRYQKPTQTQLSTVLKIF